MTTATPKLTFEDFQAQYRQCDQSYEFWYGEAIPKGMPTLVHGLLQKILMKLLDQAGFISASEIELRIEAGAHPKPDVIAAKTKLSGRYLTAGVEVVVEVLSEDDSYLNVQAHCRKYQKWGFGHIYLVNAVDRSVIEWRDGAQTPTSSLVGVPVERIWEELDLQYESQAD